MMESMISIVVWTFVALATALLVMVIAVATNSEVGGLRAFFADLRAGLRDWRARGMAAPIVPAERAPVDATFDEFFAAAQVDEEPYLQLDDLTDTLVRAREQATRAGRSVASHGANLVRH